GFGDALIAMPLLTLAVGLQTAAPVFALVAFTSSIAILAGSWRDVQLREAWPLVAGSAIGVPFGLVLLTRAPESAMKLFLGVTIVVFGLSRPLLPGLQLRHGGIAPAGFAGAVAGVLGGAYNINGPAVAMYGTLRRWTPQRFRATMQGFFLPNGAMLVIGHGVAGLWSRQMLIYSAACIPAMLLGVAIGSRLNRRIRPERFELWIAALLVGIGSLLAAETLLTG
ncbi:MAG: sulfite exporter TauE/SafE family protein, partial [Acidobacteriota bacterium]|nr:sulfite exporter TauE/SafE family protein [Acidobacteriota bacterium]